MYLLGHKQLKHSATLSGSFFVSFSMAFFPPHRHFIWIKYNDYLISDIYVANMPHFCKAQILLQTQQKLVDLPRTNQVHLHCQVHGPFMFFEKRAILDSLYIFVLPSCLTCLLFLKWCVFTNQKSNTQSLFFYITI